MRPRKRFGQHFLHDQGVLQGMADAIRLKTGDRVMEIGPGQGALTDYLYADEGLHYVAVEIDRDLLFTINVFDANGQNDIKKVIFDLEWNGEFVGFFELNDDGENGDESAGDGIYSRKQSFNSSTKGSIFNLIYQAEDQSGEKSNVITQLIYVEE